MADVFGRQDQVLAGGLSSDSMFLTWPELAAINGGLGMLVQQLGLDYRQPIRRIFELGPGIVPAGGGTRIQPTYYIIGRPEGRLQFGRFIGPQALAACFYTTYGSPCSSNVLALSGKAGCKASDPSAVNMTWAMNGVILEGTGIDVSANEMVLQERLGAQFAGLKVLLNGVDLGTACSGAEVAGGVISDLIGTLF